MSDPYSFQGVTPGGLSELARRFQWLNTPPAGPSPGQEIRNFISEQAPQAPEWVTNLPSTLSNFWTQLNTPPEGTSPGQAIRNFILGQSEPPPQGGADVRSGVYEPPEPQTEARGAPGQPSPMQTDLPPTLRPPGQTQWPQPKEPAPDTTGSVPPPEPKKTTPPTPPYIPSARDRPLGELGRPDLPLQYAGQYPGLLPAPYFPQPHELMGVFQNSFRTLGGLGSGIIGRMALGLSGYLPAYWAAQQRGDELRAKIAASNFKLQAQQLAQMQAAESREYSEALAVYGPEGGKGYNEDRLREELQRIAAKYQDANMRHALDRGLPAVEALLRRRDAANQDNIKSLTQAKRTTDLAIAQERLEKLRADREKARRAEDVFLNPPGSLAPVPAGPTAAGGPAAVTGLPKPSSENQEYLNPPADTPAGTPAATEPDETTQAPAETDETTEKTAEPDAEKTEPEASAAPQAPEARAAASETPATPAAEAAGTPEAPAPARPVRLAMLDTGTVSDAPRPGELPAETPPRAPAAPPTRAAAAAGAPAVGTPEAMGATAPVPSLQAPAAAPRAPAAPPPPAAAAAAPTAAAPSYDWTATPSNARAIAGRMTFDRPEGQRTVNFAPIEALAQQMVNKTVRLQELRQYPEYARQLAVARADEIISDMHKIAQDPNIKTKDDLVNAVHKINPEFAAQLKSVIEGRFTPPNSQWSNPGYRNRLVELGSKADPGLNEYTAKNRAATLRAYSVGPEGKNLTALATAYRHLQDLRRKVENLPPAWKRAIAGYEGSQIAGVTSEEAAAIGALRNAIHTANNEYERVLLQGKPYASGIAEQERELPIVLGRKEYMLGNIDDKIHKLRDRGIELRAGFVRGSGMQPQAMLDGFDRALALGRLPHDADQQLDGTEGAALRDLYGGGTPSPTATPKPGGGVVDYKKFFGIR